jgi:hypothetical protein
MAGWYQQMGNPSGPPSIVLLNGNGAMGGTMSIHGTNFGGSQSSQLRAPVVHTGQPAPPTHG